MIVGYHFGWAAVADRPMDWEEFQMARQVLAEERVGTRVRSAQAEEDAEFAAVRDALTTRRRG